MRQVNNNLLTELNLAAMVQKSVEITIDTENKVTLNEVE